MSLFPFLDIPENIKVDDANEMPLFKEYAFDFAKNEIVLKDGKYVILEGIDALKVWVYKALKTKRYEYLAYSWNFGQEFQNLMDSPYSKKALESEAKRYLKECLLVNPYIKELKNISTTYIDNKLDIDFTLVTVYGETSIFV